MSVLSRSGPGRVWGNREFPQREPASGAPTVSVRVTWATALRVLRQLRRDRRTIADADRAVAAADAVQVRVRGPGRDVQPRRRPARRPLPVHHHVPDHVDHDAARADDGNARAVDDAAALEARPARRLRDRVRARRCGAGVGDGGGRVRRTRARRRGPIPVVVALQSSTPSWVSRSGCSQARSRRASSRPSSSCRRSCCPRSSSAACSCRGTRWRPCSSGSRCCCR